MKKWRYMLDLLKKVLAISLSCMRRAAVRVCPLGVFLYAYILHQCF